MLMLGNTGAGGVTQADPVRWILNEDPVKVLGVVYQWDDSELWDDSHIFKG